MRPCSVIFLGQAFCRGHGYHLKGATVAEGMLCRMHLRCLGWLQAACKGCARLPRGVANVQTEGMICLMADPR